MCDCVNWNKNIDCLVKCVSWGFLLLGGWFIYNKYLICMIEILKMNIFVFGKILYVIIL